MICPVCGFKNATGAKFCGKCNNKSLENLRFSGHAKTKGFCGCETKFHKHRKFYEFSSIFKINYLSSIKLKNHASVMLKALILLIAIIGISGVASAHPVSGNSGLVQKGTVYIENGFSGVVAIKDPLLHKTVNVKVNYQPYSTGSGSIVTKNGYIITAFHVIGDPRTIENTNTLKKMSSSNVKWYVEELGLMNYIKNKNHSLGLKLFSNTSNQDPNKAVGLITDKFIKNGWISTKSYKLSIKVKGLGINGISKKTLNARIVDVGNSKKDQDIALLKVDPKGKKLPALEISSKNPKIGQRISIYGYPGEKMEKRLMKHGKTKQSAAGSEDYTPFISSGYLTAKQPNPQGTVYYKTNAITAEGYSGGPVVNSSNRITGVLVYGLYGVDKISKNQGTVASLFLSPKYIKEICIKNKVPVTVA